MFASLAFLAAAQQIVIPLGRPQNIERPIAPIESSGPLFGSQCGEWDDANRAAPPVRIFGNTYLVGTCGLSSILITDPAGDILIGGGTEQGADLVADNIRALGFKPTDVRYLLSSDEGSDRAGGLGRLQRLTGAQLVASAAAAAALRTGTQNLSPIQVDRVVADGEQVRLGNTVLIASATPGRTPGAVTWHWGSCQGGLCRQIVYADVLPPIGGSAYRFSDHAADLAAYRASIARVAALDCDILLTPSPSASDMVKRLLLAKVEDRDACRNYAAGLTKQLDDRLAREAAGH